MRIKAGTCLWAVVTVIVFMGMSLSLAQDKDGLSQPLESISADNVARVAEIAGLGLGRMGPVHWSSDGERLYVPTTFGVLAYSMDNPTVYSLLDDLPFDAAPVRPFEGSDFGLPIAVSPSGAYTVVLYPVMSNERNAVLVVRETATGSEHFSAATESPLVPQRYSWDAFIPQFSDSGDLFYLRSGSLYRWNQVTNTETLLIEQKTVDREPDFTDIRINPHGTHAATYSILPGVGSQSQLAIYEITGETAVPLHRQVFAPVDRWQSVAMSPDGAFVATGGNNGNVRVWTLASDGMDYREDQQPDEFAERAIVDLAYTSDGRYLVGCANDSGANVAFVQDAQTGEPVARITGLTGTGYTYFTSVAIHPTDDLIAFGGADGTIRLWPLGDLTLGGTMGADDAPIILRAHTGPVVDISFSRDGSRLAAASWENAASVWLMADLEPIHTYPLRDRGWSAALSPDGRQLATSDASGDIILWQIDEERSAVLDQLVPLSQYDDPTVTDLAFSPDGTVLAGIGSASSLYLWNLSSTERVELPGRGSWHLQFSADGQFVVTASYSDASVRIWGVPAGS